jgi:hypothetical protein
LLELREQRLRPTVAVQTAAALQQLHYDVSAACEDKDADRLDQYAQRASNDTEPTP